MRATTMTVVNGYQSAMCGQQVLRQKGGHITRPGPVPPRSSSSCPTSASSISATLPPVAAWLYFLGVPWSVTYLGVAESMIDQFILRLQKTAEDTSRRHAPNLTRRDKLSREPHTKRTAARDLKPERLAVMAVMPSHCTLAQRSLCTLLRCCCHHVYCCRRRPFCRRRQHHIAAARRIGRITRDTSSSVTAVTCSA